MKTLFLTVTAFFAFTALASAQDEKDSTQRVPPVVTQAQVERDAKQAQQERKKHEEKKAKEENKTEGTKATTGPTSTASGKKTSSRPGKQ